MYARYRPMRPSSWLIRIRQVPITPYDNALAIQEMEDAYDTLLERQPPLLPDLSLPLDRDNVHHPFVLTLGGDHTIVSPHPSFA